MDGTGPRIAINRKFLHLTDKLLQASMAASSGLRENVYPMSKHLSDLKKQPMLACKSLSVKWRIFCLLQSLEPVSSIITLMVISTLLKFILYLFDNIPLGDSP